MRNWIRTALWLTWDFVKSAAAAFLLFLLIALAVGVFEMALIALVWALHGWGT